MSLSKPPGKEHLKWTVISSVFSTIANKTCTAHDLRKHLLLHKGQVFNNPLDIRSENGHNMLHELVDKGRLSMFTVILHFGWWKLLSEDKVPRSGGCSLHVACTAFQIAEKKKTRKPSAEVKNFTDWENSLTSLMRACRSGDITKVRALLQNDTESVLVKDKNGMNALYWTVVNGSKEIIQLLLDAGLDASTRSDKGESLLHTACVLGQNNLFDILMNDDRCKLDVYCEDANEKTPYDRVAENGDLNSLNCLLKHKKQPMPNFLVLAAHAGRQKCVEHCILELKMDINTVDMYDRTPLHRASEASKGNIVKLLLQHKPCLSCETSSKRNILHIISEAGDENLLMLCIEAMREHCDLSSLINKRDRYAGMDLCFLIRGTDKGRDAWHYVEVPRWKADIFLKKTRAGSVDVALYGVVIQSGWGVNPPQEILTYIEDMFKQRRLSENSNTDMTPLHIACFKGHEAIVNILLNNGASVHVKDCFGLTPLMLACTKGNLNIVKLLEKQGAAFQEVSNDGKLALDIAMENEHDDIVLYIKGMGLFQLTQNFVTGSIARCKNELTTERIDEIRRSGQNVQKHLIDTLREMRIDVNQYLCDIGSGPILEATE